jgi:putative exosortase-associated protein (TIGR04073 family)
MRLAFIGLVILFQLTAPWDVRAQADVSSEAPSKSYYSKAGTKLKRGLSNLSLGWFEVPGGVSDIGEKHGVGAAATWGLLHGIGKAVQRTAVGVFEVITFPVGLPKNFEPILEPEFLYESTRPIKTQAEAL